MNRISLVEIIIFLVCISCSLETELNIKNQTDLKGKFKIGIPENWHYEKETTGFSSTIIFSDTTENIEEVLIFIASWDSLEIFINEHLKNTLDSINKDLGCTPTNQEFGIYNERNFYKFDSYCFDTLNKSDFIKTHYYFNNTEKKGHLNLNIRRKKTELSKSDSMTINRILKVFDWNF